MKLITGITLLSALVLSVVADSTVMLCSDANLEGTCVFIQYKNNKCHNVPARMNDVISSVAPGGSGHHCTLFRDYDCSGPTYDVNSYVAFLSGFNDEMSSFKCSS
ncbi:hypothetical protein JR316_0000137 [Psilocybe cubensis]|uniref:Uncharacterized protein n=2 Tax=Psilocybe cubensis TaxID=181762 RepID=A0ACB8HE43_PSICU|nr:hypothetical protein JR316_0000137 [Psilocybe cubensis]KAH9486073.1 hypothetical protein JR316_0000137 [Psilocybe cubensis]